MKIHILESEYWAKCTISKDDISNWVTDYSNEAFDILGGVSDNLNIIVIPGLPHVSSTKGVGGSTYNHELVDITFDAAIPLGAEKFKQYMREAVFHEMNHSMYERLFPREGRQLYWTILEGLGVVFDREYADGEHFNDPKTKYSNDSEKVAWLNQYLVRSTRSNEVPDSQVGMMYEVGVWLVDRAMKNTGKNVIEMTHLSCDEILKLAEVK